MTTSSEQRSENTKRLLAEMAELPPDSERRLTLRNALVEENLSLVRHYAAKFSRRGEPIEDLVQVGTIGLIKAVDRFDATREVSFSTFAVPTIVGEIRRHFRDKTQPVKVPRTITDRYAPVMRALDELTSELGQTPTPTQIAQRCDLPVDVVLEALDAANTRTVSLDAAPGGSHSYTPADQISDEDDSLEVIETADLLDALLRELSDRDRSIIELRVRNRHTQAEIASQVGLSQMQVSRILTRFGKRVREELCAA